MKMLLCLLVLCGVSFAAMKLYMERVREEPITEAERQLREQQQERFSAAVATLKRKQAGFQADEKLQEKRKQDLDRWVAQKLIYRCSSEELRVTPAFYDLDFEDKSAIAQVAFLYCFEIAEGTPVYHFKDNRLLLIDSKSNQEVGVMKFDGSKWLLKMSK